MRRRPIPSIAEQRDAIMRASLRICLTDQPLDKEEQHQLRCLAATYHWLDDELTPAKRRVLRSIVRSRR
jgi:hypothetical protein